MFFAKIKQKYEQHKFTIYKFRYHAHIFNDETLPEKNSPIVCTKEKL